MATLLLATRTSQAVSSYALCVFIAKYVITQNISRK